MKKHIVFAALLLAVLGASAQDTLLMRYPKSDYLDPYGLFPGEDTLVWFADDIDQESSPFESNDKLTIYGIAAILVAIPEFEPSMISSIWDTSVRYASSTSPLSTRFGPSCYTKSKN